MRSLFAFVLFIYIADCEKFRSDYNYHSEIKGFLKLHEIPARFHDARLRCRLEGAVLASPSNTIIESAMRKEMSNRSVNTGGVFTGVHATFSKGDFSSIEGIPLDNMQLQWMPNEPDNKNNDEDCILYNANKTIADIRCSEIHPYICHKESSPNMVVTECGTVDPEYKLDTQTGKCYKFHKIGQNWTRAYMTCSAEGGHLVVINSETEAKVVNELSVKTPDSSIMNVKKPYLLIFMHIGLHDWNEIGVWTTIHGTSLSEAGYEVWASDQPNNGKSKLVIPTKDEPGEHCGSLHQNDNMHDMFCSYRLPFICEKSPESLQNYDN